MDSKISEALQNTTEKNRCTISQPIAIAWEEHEQTVVEAEARRSLPRGRLRLLLRCFALLAAIVCGLTVLGLYLTKKDQAKLQLEAVEQLESHGGTVIYDYQLRPNGNVTLTAKPTQSWFGGRDWSHNVVRAYIGAKLQAYDFDGESVEVVVPNKLECPLDPLRQLKGLQDLSVHRYVDEAELEALTKLTQLKSIRFFVQPHSAVIDGLRKHLPNCDIQ